MTLVAERPRPSLFSTLFSRFNAQTEVMARQDVEVSEYLAKVDDAYKTLEEELPRQKLARAMYGLL